MHTTEEQQVISTAEREAASIVQNPYDGKFYNLSQVFACLSTNENVLVDFLAEIQINMNTWSDEQLCFESAEDRGYTMSTFKWLWQMFKDMRPMPMEEARRKRLILMNDLEALKSLNKNDGGEN